MRIHFVVFCVLSLLLTHCVSDKKLSSMDYDRAIQGLIKSGFELVKEQSEFVIVDQEDHQSQKKCFQVQRQDHKIKICLQKFKDLTEAIDAGSEIGLNVWTVNKQTKAFIRGSTLVSVLGKKDSEEEITMAHNILMNLP